MKPVDWEDSSREEVADEDPAPPDLMSAVGEDIEDSHQMNGPPDQSTESPGFTQALRKFQETNGLPVTGVVDAATREAMNVPRCGVPDQKTQPNVPVSPYATAGTSQTPERDANATGSAPVRRKRFLHRYFHGQRSRGRRMELADGRVSGLAFGKRRLKWRLLSEGYSSQMAAGEQRAAIRLAFRLWSEVTPIDFEEDLRSAASVVDITLGFGTGNGLHCFPMPQRKWDCVGLM